MKIYIAGANKEEAQKVAKLFRSAHHTIMSKWHDGDFLATATYSEEQRSLIARGCAEEISSSDALVLCASPMRIPGGKFVEAGIALGQGKPVYVLGHRENMLLWHPIVTQFDSAEDFIKFFASTTRSTHLQEQLKKVVI